MTLSDGSNPWRTLSSRIVYENEWMRVREDEVIRPDGEPGIYGVVETSIATGVVALTEDQEVVLVGQWRYPLGRYSWELPEGGVEAGESPMDAARRELSEEAGVSADRWTQLGGPLQLSNSISSEIGYVFLAEGLRWGERSPEPTEELRVARVPLHEALEMTDDGRIQDAVSVIGLLRAARHVDR